MINQLARTDEYAWVGPFEFKELFYLKPRIPSKYHWFLQHAASSDEIRTVMMEQFNEHRPVIIVFNREFTPWGGDASGYNYFFTEFLDKNYFRISGGNEIFSDIPYRRKVSDPRDFRLDKYVHLVADRRDEMITRLLELDYIEPVAE